MKSFVAVLALCASASAGVVPNVYHAGAYAYPYAYGYTAAAPAYAYAGAPVVHAQPLAAQVAPVAGLYHAVDTSVAYSQLYPAAEAYIHEDIAAEPYIDAQIEAEPYVHQEIEAEPYVHVEIAAEPYVHIEPALTPEALGVVRAGSVQVNANPVIAPIPAAGPVATFSGQCVNNLGAIVPCAL